MNNRLKNRINKTDIPGSLMVLFGWLLITGMGACIVNLLRDK